MTKREYEREYGKTKLDHVLSHMTNAFGKILEFMAILFLPLAFVEQLSIYGLTHTDQVISFLLVTMLILSAFAVREIKKLRK